MNEIIALKARRRWNLQSMGKNVWDKGDSYKTQKKKKKLISKAGGMSESCEKVTECRGKNIVG